MSDELALNKTVVRRQHEEVWNLAALDLVDSLYTDNFACHFVGGLELRGRAALKDFIAGHRRSFPDWHETVEDLIAENDRVVSRYRSTGTHHGEFQGVPASGRRVEIAEVSIYRLEHRRIAEQWGFPDVPSLLRQITPADYR